MRRMKRYLSQMIPKIKKTGAVPFMAKVDLTVASGLDLPFYRAANILLSYRLAPKLIMFGMKGTLQVKHKLFR